MSVSSPKTSAHPVNDNKSGIQEEIWQRVELSERLCEISAGVFDFSRLSIEDVRNNCLYQKERLKLQRERLFALRHKLSAQRDKLRKKKQRRKHGL
jgi:hypothetical protein